MVLVVSLDSNFVVLGLVLVLVYSTLRAPPFSRMCGVCEFVGMPFHFHPQNSIFYAIKTHFPRGGPEPHIEALEHWLYFQLQEM